MDDETELIPPSRLAPIGQSRELSLRLPFLLFVPGNLGFFFRIGIIHERDILFFRRASHEERASDEHKPAGSRSFRNSSQHK